MRRFCLGMAAAPLLFAAAPALAGPACETATWHGFDIDRDRYIRVPVTIAGVDFSAVVDSGATRSVIDRAAAERLGLSLQPGYVAQGLTGNMAGQMSAATPVRIGDVTLSLAMGVLDLGDVSRAAARPIDLVLGREIFAHGVVDIDFGENRVRFGSDRCGAQGRDTVTLKLGTKQGLYTVAATVEDRGEADFLLDLGSAVSIYLSPAYALKSKLLDGKRVSTGMTVGMEGVDFSLLSTLDTLDFAGVAMKDVPVAVPERWNQQVAGVIGLPVLARFRVQIDAARGEIRLTPRRDAGRTPFPRDRSGLSTYREGGHLRILHVARASPAERAGLRVNDRIVAIDGVDLPKAYPPGTTPIGRRPAGTVITLRTTEGRDHAITLEDYY